MNTGFLSQMACWLAAALLSTTLVAAEPTPIQTPEEWVNVTGGVRAPQKVPWTPDMTTLAAIRRAGGIGWDTGSVSGVILRGSERIAFKLRHDDKGPTLKPGDTVDIPE